MPDEWIRSLGGYRYSVTMQNYENADQYPGFFNFPIPIGDRLNTKLKFYAGPDHPHKAQQPTELTSEQLHKL